MPATEAQKRAIRKYQKTLKRIPFDVTMKYYEQIKEHADKTGEPITRYIKNAINMRIASEGGE